MKTWKNLATSLVLSLVLVFVPGTMPAFALPETPSTPEQPDTTQVETPDNPELPDNYIGEDTNTSNTSDSNDSSTSEQTNTNNDSSSSNSDTGSDSTNTSSTSTTNNTDAQIDNDASIGNTVNLDSVTGDNEADKNTGNGTVESGSAAAIADLTNTANTVSINTAGCSDCNGVVSLADLTATNSQTGAGSENDSNSSLENNTNVDVGNNLDLQNDAWLDSNSGDNSADKNTGDGTVVSGDADIVFTLINAGNNTNIGYLVFNVYDDQTGDLIIDYSLVTPTYIGGGSLGSTNSNTGADSNNTASNSLSNNNTLVIDNQGNLVNNVTLDADTGSNTADKNTGSGSVQTGDANVVANIINFLNNTFLGIGELIIGNVNIYGTLSGNILLTGLEGVGGIPSIGGLSSSNLTTGAGSDNTADTLLNNNTDIALNNNANLLSNVVIDAETGNNTADKNTGSGSVQTGDVNTNLNLVNIANTNAIGGEGTLWLVLVNDLGNWTGQIYGFPSGATVASPFYTFSVGGDGSLNALNNNTGADSSNDAAINLDQNTNVALNNNGSITNNLTIDANTGGNSASYNTGSGSIKTGDVNVAANIVNMVNNNFVGWRFVVTIVNVFGDFLGNINPFGGSNDIVLNNEVEQAVLPANAGSKTTKMIGGTAILNNSGGVDEISSNGSFIDNNSQNSEKAMTTTNETNSSGGQTLSTNITKFVQPPAASIFRFAWIILIPLLIVTASTALKRTLGRRWNIWKESV